MIKAGQRLYNLRVNKSLTLEQISAATKIRPRFLAAIEKGEYDKLPSTAYAKGFVTNYASYLGVPQKEILALFRREFDEKKHLKVLPDSLAKNSGFTVRRINIGQSFIVASLVLLILGGYLGYQYRGVILAPPLMIDTPRQSKEVKNDIMISGKTDPNATVYINNEPVSINSSGEFSKILSLFPGKSSLTIKARNRFGKETVLQRVINVKG